MKPVFTRYQKFVIAILAFLQFTVVVDFMILSPLGAMLLEELHIGPAQFGVVVSAYAFSAGLSGLVAAGFADKFDRKRFLLFFYAGFVLGTLFCGLSTSYPMLLAARIVTGLFGGVIGSISLAIVADIFPLSVRGRVMGLVQTSFSASQVLGLPIGLYLATRAGWHAPFFMLVGIAAIAGIAMLFVLQPITGHLESRAGERASAFGHLFRTATNARYRTGFLATMLLATGGFMLMPFGSTFLVQNLRVPMAKLPLVYMVTGISAIVTGPLIGRWSDVYGKYRTFIAGSLLTGVMVLWYTNLVEVPLWVVIGVNMVLFMGISARMVSSMALSSALPEMRDRGAYMSINSSMQQLSGGVASWFAGIIVSQATPTSPLEGYPRLGLIVIVATAVTVFMMGRVNRLVTASS